MYGHRQLTDMLHFGVMWASYAFQYGFPWFHNNTTYPVLFLEYIPAGDRPFVQISFRVDGFIDDLSFPFTAFV